MKTLKKFSLITFSLISLAALVVSIQQAKQSNLFLLQNIEVKSSVLVPPLEDSKIVRLAEVLLGKVSLFDLDLQAIEHRILSNDLIQSVSLQKKMPQTLLISVLYREPRAMIQNTKGVLAYVDSEGKSFSSVDLVRGIDLPLLTNFSGQNPERIKEALRLLKAWEESSLSQFFMISSVDWDSERGFRALVAYPIERRTQIGQENLNNGIRTRVDFGNVLDLNLDFKLLQLSKIFHYLTQNSIAVRQVWVDAGKKVVVKTARGS